MDVTEHRLRNRAVIEFLVLKGKLPAEILAEMVEVYGHTAPSKSTVYNWVAELKRGRETIKDEPRSGRLPTANTEENILAVEKLIIADRHITIEQISTELGISKGTIDTILHKQLKMSKVCAKWVPKFLTPIMRSDRVAMCQLLLDLQQKNPSKFLSRLVTGDETWLYHYDPESQQESKQWKRSSSPTPSRPKGQRASGKIMASVFWDAEGVLLIDYLPHSMTVTGVYYAQLMRNLREAIKKKRRGKLSQKVLLLHDNAPPHKAKVAVDAIKDCGFTELPHPPYSPDLAPSDYYLFAALKKDLRGRRFDDDKDVQTAAEHFFDSKNSSFFLHGMEMLPSRWTTCIQHEGHYTEC